MLKKNGLAAMGLAMAFVGPAFAGLIATNGSTNNVSDFIEPSTGNNVIGGGHWSYLIGGTSDLTPTNNTGLWDTGLLTGGGSANGINFSNTWNTQYNQYTRLIGEDSGGGERVATDYRPVIYNYTIDSNEGGTVEIKGTLGVYGGSDSYNLFVLQSTDSSLTSIAPLNDTAEQKTLFSSIGSLSADGTVPFDIITTVAPGNDILLAYSTNGSGDYLAFRTLNATITSVVPEPATFGILGLVLMQGLRRRRTIAGV